MALGFWEKSYLYTFYNIFISSSFHWLINSALVDFFEVPS